MTEPAIDEDRIIRSARRQLRAQLAAAGQAVNGATRALSDLCGHDVYDVEYAEGTVGSDIASCLADASRSLRAAQALAATVPQ